MDKIIFSMKKRSLRRFLIFFVTTLVLIIFWQPNFVELKISSSLWKNVHEIVFFSILYTVPLTFFLLWIYREYPAPHRINDEDIGEIWHEIYSAVVVTFRISAIGIITWIFSGLIYGYESPEVKVAVLTAMAWAIWWYNIITFKEEANEIKKKQEKNLTYEKEMEKRIEKELEEKKNKP